MRWFAGLVAGTVACGRIGFAPVGTGTGDDANGDGAPDGSATVSLFQAAKDFNTGNVSTFTTQLGTPTQAGDLIVVAVGAYTSITNVTDDAPGGSSAYIGTGAVTNDTNFDFTDIWYTPVSHAGATRVTVTMAASNLVTMWVAEFSGFAASPLESTAVDHHDNAGTTSITAPGGVVTVPGSLVFVMANMYVMTPTLTTPSFSDLGQQNSRNAVYQLAPAAGTYSAAWTFDMQNVSCVSVAVFRPR